MLEAEKSKQYPRLADLWELRGTGWREASFPGTAGLRLGAEVCCVRPLFSAAFHFIILINFFFILDFVQTHMTFLVDYDFPLHLSDFLFLSGSLPLHFHVAV